MPENDVKGNEPQTEAPYLAPAVVDLGCFVVPAVTGLSGCDCVKCCA